MLCQHKNICQWGHLFKVPSDDRRSEYHKWRAPYILDITKGIILSQAILNWDATLNTTQIFNPYLGFPVTLRIHHMSSAILLSLILEFCFLLFWVRSCTVSWIKLFKFGVVQRNIVTFYSTHTYRSTNFITHSTMLQSRQRRKEPKL